MLMVKIDFFHFFSNFFCPHRFGPIRKSHFSALTGARTHFFGKVLTLSGVSDMIRLQRRIGRLRDISGMNKG